MPRHTNRLATRTHDELSWRALRWIGSRATYSGIRGGVEVRLAKQYVADCVCLARFEHRFAQRYCDRSGVALKTKHWIADGQWAETGDVYQEWLMVFESKRSRGDFRATFGNPDSPRLAPFGHMHWCVTPKGLIKPGEMPGWWGLLEERGNGLREVRKPIVQVIDDAVLDRVARELLWNHATNTVELESEVEAASVESPVLSGETAAGAESIGAAT